MCTIAGVGSGSAGTMSVGPVIDSAEAYSASSRYVRSTLRNCDRKKLGMFVCVSHGTYLAVEADPQFVCRPRYLQLG